MSWVSFVPPRSLVGAAARCFHCAFMNPTPPPNGWRTFLMIWLTQTLYPAPEQKTELAWALSLLALAFALPTVFGAPLAGLWVDRYDRRQTMIAMDLLSGLLSLFLCLLMA